MKLLKGIPWVQQPKLLLKNIAIFYNAIFRSGGIKKFNITHNMCNVRSYIKIKRGTCWGRLDIVSSQAPMWPSALSCCSHSGRMERTGRIKTRKLMARDKNSLIWRRQGRREWCKWHPFPTPQSVHKQWPSQKPKIPLLPPPLLLLITVVWYELSLWSIWVSCPSCVLSQPLAHPPPPDQRAKWQEEKAVTVCEFCKLI